MSRFPNRFDSLVPSVTCLLLCLTSWTGAAQPANGDGPGKTSISLSAANDETLKVEAFWEPIKESQYDFAASWDELGSFKPAKDLAEYSGRTFQGLLPDKPVDLGATWALDAAAGVELMKQFHPGASATLRVNNGDSPEGGLGILVRYNERYAMVLTRFHGTYVLNEGWLTPGQFQGHLVLDRKSGRVKYFRWHVPLAAVNFDANHVILDGEIGGRPIDPKNPPVATDAGILPRMELRGGDESGVADARWTGSISDADAWDRLEKQMYPFRKIEWVAFEDALRAARRDRLPLHIVTVDGTLCDESCCGTGKSLRAGPLSDKQVADLLNARCINTWILNSQLPTLRDNGSTEDTRALANAVLQSRQPKSPVDSMVFTPSLELVSVLAANDFLGQKREGQLADYMSFLDGALDKISHSAQPE